MAQPPCKHFDSNSLKAANEHVCEECVKTGDSWVHLRTCQTCGKTHCCDSSPNKHATKHFHASQHSVIISAELGNSELGVTLTSSLCATNFTI